MAEFLLECYNFNISFSEKYILLWILLFFFSVIKFLTQHFSLFSATLTLSVGVAYVLAMLVEFPFIGILKVLFPRERHKKESDRVAIINDTDDATQAWVSVISINQLCSPWLQIA